MNQQQQVTLVFEKPTEDARAQEYMAEQGVQPAQFEIELDRFINYFKGFKVDSIVLSFSGALDTGGITKLFVSARGEAGVTVTLKPEQS